MGIGHRLAMVALPLCELVTLMGANAVHPFQCWRQAMLAALLRCRAPGGQAPAGPLHAARAIEHASHDQPDPEISGNHERPRRVGPVQ